MKKIVFIFLLALPLAAKPQLQGQALADSLRAEIPNIRNDSVKVMLYAQMAQSFFLTNSDSAIWYAKKGQNTARNIKWLEMVGRLGHHMCKSCLQKANYSEGLKAGMEALRIFEALNLRDRQALANGTISSVYHRLKDYPKAVNYGRKGIDMIDTVQKRLDYAVMLANLGMVYEEQRMAEEALNYSLKAYRIFGELGMETNRITCLLTIANVYLSQKNYAEAENSYRKVLELNRSTGDPENYASCYGSMGEMYICQLKDKSVPGKNSIPGSRESLAARAVTCLQNAIGYAKQNSDPEAILHFQEYLWQAYYYTGNYRSALEEHREYTALKDSIFSEDNRVTIAKLETQREKELRERQVEINRVQKENHEKQERQERTEKNIYIGGSLALLLISGLSLRGYRLKKKANGALLEAKLRAEESERFKQQFLDTMSHEIRTPLNAIVGMSRLLKDQVNPARQQQYVESIDTSSTLLLQTVNDILDFSKLEAERVSLERIPFSIHREMERLKQVLKLKAGEKKLRLITIVSANVPGAVKGDPGRLNQVLMNLSSNAIKFTEKGSVVLEAKCIALEEGRVLIRFSVTDTGIGIPADKQQAVFDSFVQADTSHTRQYGGTGLGLAICQKLVALQGGELKLESEEGLGSCFSFDLAFDTADPSDLSKESGQKPHYNLDGLRVLITDDNEYNRMLAEEQLRSAANVEITTAVNGEEAIAILGRKQFDLVLMDVQMPVMDGVETTRRIRAQVETPQKDIPIIALTASMSRNDLRANKAAGFTDFLMKPYEPADLLAAIGKATGRPATAPPQKPVQSKKQQLADLQILRSYFGDDETRIAGLTRTFVQTVTKTIEEMKAALEDHEIGTLGKLAHRMRPKLEVMGMQEASEMANTIEFLSHEGEKVQVEDLAHRLMQQMIQSIEELKQGDGYDLTA